MATIDNLSSGATAQAASAQQALLQQQQRAGGPSEQAAGSDNRTVGATQQSPVNSATAAAQRSTIAEAGAGQEQRPGEAARETRGASQQQGFEEAVRVDIRSAQGQQAANANNDNQQPPAGGRPEGVQVNFSAGGAVEDTRLTTLPAYRPATPHRT